MTTLKKVMTYMPDEEYERLRRLAFERHVSMSDLIRQALGKTYGWEIEPTGKREAA